MLTTSMEDNQRGFRLFNRTVMRDLGAERCGAMATGLGCVTPADFFSAHCSAVSPKCLNLTTCPFFVCKPGCGEGASNMDSPHYWARMADRGEVYNEV